MSQKETLIGILGGQRQFVFEGGDVTVGTVFVTPFVCHVVYCWIILCSWGRFLQVLVLADGIYVFSVFLMLFSYVCIPESTH